MSKREKLHFVVEGPNGSSGTGCVYRRMPRDAVAADIYVTRAGLKGSKISLHGSRLCTFGLSREFYDHHDHPIRPDKSQRSYVRFWRTPTPEASFVTALAVRFPTDHLLGPRQRDKQHEPLWIFEAPPAGQMLELQVVFHRSDPDDMVEQFRQMGIPTYAFKIRDREWATALFRVGPFDPSFLPSPDKLVGVGGRLIHRELLERPIGEPMRDLPGMFWNTPADGGVLIVAETGGWSVVRNA